jgi:hypothetical protein
LATNGNETIFAVLAPWGDSGVSTIVSLCAYSTPAGPGFFFGNAPDYVAQLRADCLMPFPSIPTDWVGSARPNNRIAVKASGGMPGLFLKTDIPRLSLDRATKANVTAKALFIRSL